MIAHLRLTPKEYIGLKAEAFAQGIQSFCSISRWEDWFRAEEEERASCETVGLCGGLLVGADRGGGGVFGRERTAGESILACVIIYGRACGRVAHGRLRLFVFESKLYSAVRECRIEILAVVCGYWRRLIVLLLIFRLCCVLFGRSF